jgi:adenosylmethionine-8-amino-7-oxononanoate aminotransferase
LAEIREDPLVGDVRQIGLMAGIELVRDKKTQKSFPPALKMGQRVCAAARRYGVWMRPLGDVVVLVPPLGISVADLKILLDAVRRALGDVRVGEKM